MFNLPQTTQALELYKQERERGFLVTSEGHRLAKRTNAWRPRRTDRFLARLGGFLVESGQKLKARYEPVTQQNSSLKSRPELGC